MVGDGVLTIRTGPGGSGKTYWVVKWLTEEVLPYYKDSRVMTNLPLLSKDPRILVRDFPANWQPTLEECEGFIVIVDEAHRVFNRDNDKAFRAVIGEARHYNTRWVLLSQSKDKLPGWVDEEAEIWFESANGRVLRDQTFGLRIYDLQNLWAKATGKFHEFFQLTEYVRANRRWKSIQNYKEWFDPKVGQVYNSKNTQGAKDTGDAVVLHDYMRFNWPTLIAVVARRNWHVVPVILMKNGMPIVFVGVGVGWMSWSWFNGKPSIAMSQPVAPTKQLAPAGATPPRPTTPQAVPPRVSSGRIISFALFVAIAIGCRAPHSTMQGIVPSPNQQRAAGTPLPDPRVAVLGAGHSLDAALKQAGYSSNTGEVIDGPLVGREIIQTARRLGFDLEGSKLVPAPREYVAVPDELSGLSLEGAIDVGGIKVVRATAGQQDEWREMSDFVQESYSVELAICSVGDDQSRNLGVVMGATGTVDLDYIAKPKLKGAARVRITADGAVVAAREVARPVLHASHGVEATVHVGTKYPVRTSQTTTDGTTRSVGGTVSYVSTGVEVSLKPSRINRTQVRLVGQVSVSEQTASNDGIPVTAERRVSVDRILTLGDRSSVARLDRAREESSGAWYGLGGLRHASSDTFVVTALVTQTTDLSRIRTPSATLHTHDDPKPSKPIANNNGVTGWDLTPAGKSAQATNATPQSSLPR